MPPAKIPPELRAAAPDLGRRFGVIVAALAALIARAFLRHPTRAALIVPLWRYLTRTARRFDRLMAHIAAGQLPPKRRPGTRSGSRAVPLPSTRAWLVIALRHEAAAFASQLQSLLAEPEAAGLLATTPAAGRLLRPLCRMLGLPAAGSPKAPGRPPTLPRGPAKPEHANPEPATPVSITPPTPSAACQNPPPPRLPKPPCPRARWPWFPFAPTSA